MPVAKKSPVTMEALRESASRNHAKLTLAEHSALSALLSEEASQGKITDEHRMEFAASVARSSAALGIAIPTANNSNVQSMPRPLEPTNPSPQSTGGGIFKR